MSVSISASVGSYESGAVNKSPDVMTVQQLLIAADSRHPGCGCYPGRPDGKIHQDGTKSSTVKAILAFQGNVVGFQRPDGRVDVSGRTWRNLAEQIGSPVEGPTTVPTPGTRPLPDVVTGEINVTFSHGGKIPTNTNGLTSTHSDMYESTVTVSGAASGTFRGSIYPDDMEVKGHLYDGSYPIHIGFHKGGNKTKQGASNLVVKRSGIRAGLLVNARESIRVNSNNASKTTSVGINIHNGFRNNRGSDGCLTIHPDYWTRFITIFLDAFPNIDDWHKLYGNTGKKIGTVTIKS